MNKQKPISTNAIVIKFHRVKNKQVLTLRLNKKVAEVFKNLSSTTLSNSWVDDNGQTLKYYKLNDEMVRLVDSYNCYCPSRYRVTLSDFGSSTYGIETNNFSILRCIDIQKGIKWQMTSRLLTDEEIKLAITHLGEFVKWVYLNYIQVITVKATVKFNY